MDDAADVVGGHALAHVDLAGVEVDLHLRHAGRPAEGGVGVAAIGRVVERLAGVGVNCSSIRSGPASR
jgi:hypothetical protein